MSRSSKKGPYIDEKLLKKIMAQKESGKITVFLDFILKRIKPDQRA